MTYLPELRRALVDAAAGLAAQGDHDVDAGTATYLPQLRSALVELAAGVPLGLDYDLEEAGRRAHGDGVKRRANGDEVRSRGWRGGQRRLPLPRLLRDSLAGSLALTLAALAALVFAAAKLGSSDASKRGPAASAATQAPPPGGPHASALAPGVPGATRKHSSARGSGVGSKPPAAGRERAGASAAGTPSEATSHDRDRAGERSQSSSERVQERSRSNAALGTEPAAPSKTLTSSGPSKLPSTTTGKTKLPSTTTKLPSTTTGKTKLPSTTTKLPSTTTGKTKLPSTTTRKTKAPKTTIGNTKAPSNAPATTAPPSTTTPKTVTETPDTTGPVTETKAPAGALPRVEAKGEPKSKAATEKAETVKGVEAAPKEGEETVKEVVAERVTTEPERKILKEEVAPKEVAAPVAAEPAGISTSLRAELLADALRAASQSGESDPYDIQAVRTTSGKLQGLRGVSEPNIPASTVVYFVAMRGTFANGSPAAAIGEAEAEANPGGEAAADSVMALEVDGTVIVTELSNSYPDLEALGTPVALQAGSAP